MTQKTLTAKDAKENNNLSPQRTPTTQSKARTANHEGHKGHEGSVS